MNIIIAAADHARLIAAMELALASAALGKAPRLFLQGDAARLIALPLAAPSDALRRGAGLPDLVTIWEEVVATEVPIIACQSALLLAGLTMADIPPEAQSGGLISFLTGGAPDHPMVVY